MKELALLVVERHGVVLKGVFDACAGPLVRLEVQPSVGIERSVFLDADGGHEAGEFWVVVERKPPTGSRPDRPGRYTR